MLAIWEDPHLSLVMMRTLIAFNSLSSDPQPRELNAFVCFTDEQLVSSSFSLCSQGHIANQPCPCSTLIFFAMSLYRKQLQHAQHTGNVSKESLSMQEVASYLKTQDAHRKL